MNSNRYEVRLGSESCHCCFEATIVDRTQPIMIDGEHYNDSYVSVCECLDEGVAHSLCRLLNETGGAFDCSRPDCPCIGRNPARCTEKACGWIEPI